MGYEILICLGGLIAGILFACGIPESNVPGYLMPILVAVAASAFWKPKSIGISRSMLFSVLTGFCCFFFAGWVLISTNRFVPMPSQAGQTIIIAKIVSYRKVNEKSGQLVVRVLSENPGSGWAKRCGKMLLLVKPDPLVTWHSGDQWRFGPISVSAVSSKPLNSGFVPRRYWLSRGVGFQSWLQLNNARLIKTNPNPSVRAFFLQWQQILSDRIDRIDLSPAGRSLIKAMILGDRRDIEDSTINNFSRAGIIHVLSVSGLHVGIVWFLISSLLRLVRFAGPKLRSVLSLAVVWLYVGVTGFSPSALRSGGMIALFEFAGMGRRGTPGLQILASTAIIQCLIDPYTIFGAGSQLSYLAVAGIFIWNPVFRPIMARLNRVGRYFAGAVSISLSAQGLILPVLLFWFGWFPLYFLIGNVFLLPLMIFCFYLGLIITVMDFAGCTFHLFGQGLDFLIRIVMGGAEWLGNLPGNVAKPEGLVWADVVLYYFVILMVRSYAKIPDARKIKGVLAGTGLILILRMFWRPA